MNNWIKINTKEDLPKENGNYFCLYEDGSIIIHFYTIGKDFDNILFLEEFTHYQKVINPKLPNKYGNIKK